MPSILGWRRTRIAAFIAFVLCVALMGGGSRADIQSLVILRPLAILFAAYAITILGWSGIKQIGAPLWLLVSIAMLILLQLTPLPPALWQALPQFEIAARIGEKIGIDDVWRPLALSPTRAWNSFFALSVPIAAMLLYQAQDKAGRTRALPAFLLIGVTGAVLSLLQIGGSPEGPFYLYRVTNPGSAVGLFANRNHHAVLLGALILVAAWWFRSIKPESRQANLRAGLAVGAMLLFVPAILLTGSRAGLLIGGLALALGFLHIRKAPLIARKIKVGRDRAVDGRWLLAGGAAAFGALVLLTLYLARALSIERLLADEAITSLRARLLPTLGQMMGEYFPFGSGFGSFEFAYRMHEPEALLGPKYLNEAHNDWVQWIIEGGLPALAILIAFLIWFAIRFVGELRRDRRRTDGRGTMAAQLVILLGISSLFDYPLRVPFMMVFAVIACMTLQDRRDSGEVH